MVKNSYSSGRNDDRIAHPNGKNEPQEFADEGTDEGVHEKDVMQCHSYSAVGNMNLNRCARHRRPPATHPSHPSSSEPVLLSLAPAQHARGRARAVGERLRRA